MREIEIDEMHVEILPLEGKVKCLEQMNTLVDQVTTEVQHRVRCAWSAFAKHRQQLTSPSHLLRHRFHLFDAVVTPTITYGAGTWAATKEQEEMLRTAQRRMLRLIIQTERKYKSKKKKHGGKVVRDDEISEDTQEEDSTHDEYDQDSSISFDDDEDSTASQEDDLEELD